MIERFTGQYAFLSNFHYCTIITPDGWVWPSVEHAYQGAKCISDQDKIFILNLNTAGKAKRAGRSVACRSGWGEIKDDVMLALLYIKFGTILELKKKLLATGDEYLQEGNHWDDPYWGRVMVGGRWVGENRLGKLLMEVREDLR